MWFDHACDDSSSPVFCVRDILNNAESYRVSVVNGPNKICEMFAERSGEPCQVDKEIVRVKITCYFKTVRRDLKRRKKLERSYSDKFLMFICATRSFRAFP